MPKMCRNILLSVQISAGLTSRIRNKHDASPGDCTEAPTRLLLVE